MMRIATRGGHNFQATGARGIIDETTEDRKVKDSLIKYLIQAGNEVLDVTPGNCDVNTDLSYGVNKANSWGADLFISVHFNKAYEKYAGGIGTETWIYGTGGKAEPIAHRITDSLASKTGLINRGVKVSTKLYELRRTSMAAIIVEVCFVEATEDVNIYISKGYDFIAKCIAEGIINNSITTPTPAPVQPKKESEGSFMSKVYRNGSTIEEVFADSNLLIKIGNLDPKEICECIAEVGDKKVVLYNTSTGKKVGFCKYAGGL